MDNSKFNLRSSIMYMVDMLLPHGPGEMPKAKNLIFFIDWPPVVQIFFCLTLDLQAWSGWILSVAWWFYIFMFMCSFTANLASYLSFSRDRTRVRVIDDLEKLPYMK